MCDSWLAKHKTTEHGLKTVRDVVEVEQQTDDSLRQTISRLISPFAPSPDSDPVHSTAEPHSLDFDFLTDVDNNVISINDSGYVEPKIETSQKLAAKTSGVIEECASRELPASRDTKPRPNPQRTAFQCNVCNRYMASELKLQVHAAMHRNDDDLKCHECDKELKNKPCLPCAYIWKSTCNRSVTFVSRNATT